MNVVIVPWLPSDICAASVAFYNVFRFWNKRNSRSLFRKNCFHWNKPRCRERLRWKQWREIEKSLWIYWSEILKLKLKERNRWKISKISACYCFFFLCFRIKPTSQSTTASDIYHLEYLCNYLQHQIIASRLLYPQIILIQLRETENCTQNRVEEESKL